MTGNLFSTLLRVSGWVLSTLGFAALFEAITQHFLPPGTALCLIELLVGIICIAWTYRSPSRERRAFANSIAFIVLADTSFYFLNYYQPVNLNTEYISLLTSLLYAAGFILASTALIRAAGLQLKRDWKKFVVPGLIALVTFLFYFLPTMKVVASEGGARLFIQGLVLTANLVISIVSLTLLIHSMNSFLVLSAFGFSILPLLNFSISAEIFSQGHLTFGFYEYFWAFGLFFAEASLVFLAQQLDVDRDSRLTWVSNRSIGVQYKTSIIAAVMVMLIGSSFFASGLLSIRVVTTGIVIGIIIAVMVSSFAVEAVSRYSALLGRYLEQGFTSQKWNEKFVKDLPVELEVLFSAVFAQSLEKERDRQVRASRNQELYQKFAHDIRSPLKAVAQLISTATFEDAERKAACQTSVQSMTRASQSILNELELNTGVPSAHLTLPAIRLENVLHRVIQTFEFSQNLDSSISIQLDEHSNLKYAWIDETLLERFLLNALQNSAESKATQIQIRSASQNGRILLEITDNGSGTDTETLALLNQGKVITRKSDGHGIGLSGHREAIHKAEASLHFDSVLGQFFKVSLNLKAATPQIILIDDDRAIHLAWQTLAKLRGVELCVLGPHDSIPKKLLTSQPEIYVDYHLGDRSGILVLEELQKMGFQNLFLATSDELPSEISKQWKVRDKSFPRT